MKASYFAVPLLVFAVVETGNALLAPLRVAPAKDWDDAAAEVRAGFEEGDLIVFAPDWADQIGRAHLGDLVTVEMAGHADADTYGRVWEVSIRGAHHPEAAGKLVKETRHGKVRVALYEKIADQIFYDFTAEEPRVTSVGADGEKPAAHIERRTLEIDYRPRRGLLIPVETSRTTALSYDDVLCGSLLVGYTGLHDYFARKNGDGVVDVRVFIDGQKQLELHARNEDGWKRFELKTAPGHHAVRFEISSSRPAWRNLGLHVEARK
jgi:hypothetical protein